MSYAVKSGGLVATAGYRAILEGLDSARVPPNIGPYRILSKLGEGGMGVVYAAHDPRLHRKVAIKIIREALNKEPFRERFWLEARSAAGLSHPNICQVYEVGEHEGQPYLVMELLEGEALAARLERGALPPAEAMPIILGVLAALEALHRRGSVHRDLKPSNVFLTAHGAKLLDFGLARSFDSSAGPESPTLAALTLPGTIVGTPRYMSPEQLQGMPCVPASDLFAAGAMLYEMLTGRYAFPGDTLMPVFQAIMTQPPPLLPEGPGARPLNDILRRALARAPEERYRSAEAMAQELRSASAGATTSAGPVLGRWQRRLIVLPFRMLRPDPEMDFLAFSLPDAITSSLSGLESLVVRSSLAAARFAAGVPDLRAIAAEADVNAVLTGSLLRAGDQLRLSAQLVEAPSGTLIWSHTAQVALRDLFQVHDELLNRIVDSLSVPLTAREQEMVKKDVPASATAYELYLRANQAGSGHGDITVARDLYLGCLELDPRYAPAWARLARCHWIQAKWGAQPDEDQARAEQAFQKAFELNPDLAVAHNFYARFEADRGRAIPAVERLLGRVKLAPSDAELYVGLVHACRYAGLLEASAAAHHRALQLDPQARTSVEHTYFMMGDYERVMTAPEVDMGYAKANVLVLQGRTDQALERMPPADQLRADLRDFPISFRAMLEGKTEESVQAMERLLSHRFMDLEGAFYLARQMARLEQNNRALEILASVTERGYCGYSALTVDPWFEPLRGTPQFQSIVEKARALREEAQRVFSEAGGDQALKVGPR